MKFTHLLLSSALALGIVSPALAATVTRSTSPAPPSVIRGFIGERGTLGRVRERGRRVSRGHVIRQQNVRRNNLAAKKRIDLRVKPYSAGGSSSSSTSSSASSSY
ncbi:MAG: hypothetical protein Q7R81_01105 [Candidatus Peregrinibacteria bacterium]|nr:hypothetical protein [Candidatus Peregrinibacteria bacterium]